MHFCHVLSDADDPECVATRPPVRAAPRIGCFNTDEPQYFLYVENNILFSVSTLVMSSNVLVYTPLYF